MPITHPSRMKTENQKPASSKRAGAPVFAAQAESVEEIGWRLTDKDWEVPPKFPRTILESVLPNFESPDCSRLQKLVRDLWRSALHEAAHTIVAREFRPSASAHLFPTRDSNPESSSVGGQCRYPPLSDFRKCCMAWAGPLADAISLPEGLMMTDVAFFFETARDRSYSATDEAGMAAHPQAWRACKTAHRILRRRRKAFAQYSRELVHDFWENVTSR